MSSVVCGRSTYKRAWEEIVALYRLHWINRREILAMLAAIRRASSLVSSFAADLRGSSSRREAALRHRQLDYSVCGLGEERIFDCHGQEIC